MEVRRGYKHTAVGVIPEAWNVSRLRELAEIRSGVAKNSKASVSDPIRVHYLRVANVQDGFLDLAEMSKLEISRHDLARYAVLPGDVLMNEGGDLDQLGRGSIWLGQFEPCVHQNHVFVVRCGSSLSPQYLNTWSGGAAARRYFLVAGKQTTNLASINKTALGALPVATPPIPEQCAIATAISDVDALLEGLTRLIAKKRDLKQAATQQLLTGRTRLPSFDEAWQESTVRVEFDVTLGKMLDSEKNVGVPKPYIGNRAVQWGFIDVTDLQTVPLSHVDMHKYRLAKGDLLVCEGGEVGRAAIWSAPIEECYYQKALHRLRPLRGMNAQFMAALLELWAKRGVLQDFVTQTSIAHLPREKFRQMPIPVPPPVEQTAIAVVLSDMDAELAALEARREKTRAIKQAMMQELLTGKTRLV